MPTPDIGLGDDVVDSFTFFLQINFASESGDADECHHGIWVDLSDMSCIRTPRGECEWIENNSF